MEGGPRRERDDPDPLAADVEQPPRGRRRRPRSRRSPPRRRAGGGPEAAGRTGSSAVRWYERASSHGARSRRVTTTGRPGQRAARTPRPRGRRRLRHRRRCPPRGADAGAAEHERIDRQRSRPQEVGRGQQAPTDDLEIRVRASWDRRGPTGGAARTTRPRVAPRRRRRAARGGRRRSAASDRAPGSGGRRGRRERPPAGRRPAATGRDRVPSSGIAGIVTAARPRRARDRPPEARPDLLGTELDDDDERLDHDPPAHLRLADAPIAERDRHLADPRSAT